MFHWTDSKIRCHLLTCVIALTMKRLLELKVEPVLARVSWLAISQIRYPLKINTLRSQKPMPQIEQN